MTEQTKKIVLPAYLIRRCEAFRIVKGDAQSYILRDKLHGKTYDFDPWQFFILEVLPGCESFEKLQSVFHDRFDRQITKLEFDELLAGLADSRLLDQSALQHPLLTVFAKRSYDVVDGKAVPRAHTASVGFSGVRDKAPEPVAAPKPADAGADLPPGVQDAIGLDERATTRMLELFDPRPLLGLLAPAVAPLRHAIYALPVMLLVALMVAGRYSHLLVEDLQGLHAQLSLFVRVVFVLFTVNALATIVTAFVAHSYKVAVERIGITLYVGFIPRFVTRMRGVERLSRRERMWLHGSNLVLRLLLFCAGVLLWYSTRDSQGVLQDLSLMVVLTVGASILLEAGNPLAKGSAYFLLSAYLNEPHLRGKAYKALLNKLKAGVYQSSDSTVLALYALATMTYLIFIIGFLSLGLTQWLLGHLDLGGSALLVAGAFAGYLLWRNYVGLKKFGDTYERTAQFDRWRRRTLIAEGQVEGELVTQRPSYWKRALLVCLPLLLLLPYPYQPSGSFTLFPAAKQVLSTDTPGLIEAVFFEGGESVKQGTVLAQLSHADYAAQIKVLDAKIDEQKAVLADLKARPKPEEVKLAQQVLDVARTREVFSREKAPRIEKLYQAGAATLEDLESARKDHSTDMMQVAEKQAALDLVKVGATPDQIAAAEAKLGSLKEERQIYVDKVARTALRMPFDGNILTLHLKDRINSYLDKGQPFASIENTGLVTAEIEIVESDLQYVRIGAAVRARPAAFFNREFEGKVTLIDRNVTTKSFGNVVKVIATIDNPDGLLKTGMTGQAKIEGVSLPVWEAFSQAIVRFVRVQAWSWIP
ncbi:MAG: efflux RND transporter periplasmic adaptor subunit [Ideonella sp.]|nr:efflux RND transporter periplasmic adaptor subunit [Ideonella sp.]